MQTTEMPARSRTITWDDPQRSAGMAAQLSGLEFLNAIGRGDVPHAPIMKLVGLEPLEVSAGRAVFVLEPAEYHYNPMGVVHGGIISTLLDTAMFCAVYTMLPAGTVSTTVELHINFLRPMTVETGVVRCEGETLHAGRTIATAQARLVDAAGKLYAHGTTTCMIVRGDR
jgi:uncharacterized protein (TIGR00369 family)